MQPKQMMVTEYAQKYIPLEKQGIFYRMMREWDGSPDYYNAFYDVDVLEMIHGQVLEQG